jgi:hypothetical protein
MHEAGFTQAAIDRYMFMTIKAQREFRSCAMRNGAYVEGVWADFSKWTKLHELWTSMLVAEKLS